ncbi:MAG TPA: ankyrin repeat domain-containing protein [candidate division Zixibacteria bacterium]|nr:ankyrin repeat domain-containing protein [candidate division Zixibacteria bacterium]
MSVHSKIRLGAVAVLAVYPVLNPFAFVPYAAVIVIVLILSLIFEIYGGRAKLISLGTTATLLLAALHLTILFGAGGRLRRDPNYALRAAVDLKSERLIRECVRNGADINTPAVDSRGHRQNPLIYAAVHRQPDMLRLLLELGADSRLADRDNEQIQMIAAGNHSVEMLRTLNEYGVRLDVRAREGGKSTLHAAVSAPEVSAGDTKATLQFLLEHGVDPNSRDDGGVTALEYAAFRCYPEEQEVIKVLMDHGADPLLQDSWKNTALDGAKSCNDKASIALLSRDSSTK